MFQRILAWLRKVLSMFASTDIQKSLGIEIAISGDMETALKLWSDMYADKASWLDDDIFSLGLPAAIASQISTVVCLEMKVTIDGSPRADFLTEQFKKVMDKLRENVELGTAKGGMIFKPYIDDDGLAVDFVQADQFFPVSFDANQKLTAVIFIDQKIIGKYIYTRVEYHSQGKFADERGVLVDGYQIINKAFRSEDTESLGIEVQLSEVAEWSDLAPIGTIKNVKQPLFGYYRYPSANNVDSTSPLGVSCYARAAQVGNNKKSLIQQADEHWSNLLWEFDSGKRALYLDVLAFAKSTDGTPYLPNKRLYRTLNATSGVDSEEFFQEWSPTFREASLLNGLEAILRKIEYNCGLAYGIISNPVTVDKTATEFKITQQNFFRTIKDNQKTLQEALEELIYAMDVWTTVGKLNPKGTFETAFEFDDSVIVDSTAQFQQDLLVLDRVLSRVEFRVRNYGETEEIAKQKIAMVDLERQPTELFPPTE